MELSFISYEQVVFSLSREDVLFALSPDCTRSEYQFILCVDGVQYFFPAGSIYYARDIILDGGEWVLEAGGWVIDVYPEGFPAELQDEAEMLIQEYIPAPDFMVYSR